MATGNQQWNLKGKRALVTGGTKGIGLAIVNELVALDAEVFLIARNEEQVSALVKDLKAGGGIAHGLAGDLSNASFRKKLVDKLQATWPAVDILVNNVGTNIRRKFTEYSE